MANRRPESEAQRLDRYGNVLEQYRDRYSAPLGLTGNKDPRYFMDITKDEEAPSLNRPPLGYTEGRKDESYLGTPDYERMIRNQRYIDPGKGFIDPPGDPVFRWIDEDAGLSSPTSSIQGINPFVQMAGEVLQFPPGIMENRIRAGFLERLGGPKIPRPGFPLRATPVIRINPFLGVDRNR